MAQGDDSNILLITTCKHHTRKRNEKQQKWCHWSKRMFQAEKRSSGWRTVIRFWLAVSPWQPYCWTQTKERRVKTEGKQKVEWTQSTHPHKFSCDRSLASKNISPRKKWIRHKKVKSFGAFNEAKKNDLCENHASLFVGDAVTVRRFLYNWYGGVYKRLLTKPQFR